MPAVEKGVAVAKIEVLVCHVDVGTRSSLNDPAAVLSPFSAAAIGEIRPYGTTFVPARQVVF